MASAAAIWGSWALWQACGCKRPPEWGDPPREGGRIVLERWEPLQAWVLVLGDVPDEALEVARIEIARSIAPWWPTIPQVLDVVRRHDEAPRLRGDDLWGRIASTFGAPGEWTSRIRREFGPDAEAVIATIDAIGGWATVGGATASDIPHVRRRLAETWDAGRRREHEAAEHGSATRLLDERRALRLVRDDSPTLERPGITEWARGGGR